MKEQFLIGDIVEYCGSIYVVLRHVPNSVVIQKYPNSFYSMYRTVCVSDIKMMTKKTPLRVFFLDPIKLATSSYNLLDINLFQNYISQSDDNIITINEYFLPLDLFKEKEYTIKLKTPEIGDNIFWAGRIMKIISIRNKYFIDIISETDNKCYSLRYAEYQIIEAIKFI